LTERYEALRAYALGTAPAGGLAQGLVVLLRHGLPTWLETWRQAAPVPPAGRSEVAATQEPAEAIPVELPAVLAEMALHLVRG
jgi:hypothetical protein